MTDKTNTTGIGKFRLESLVFFSATLWVLLWLSINTGPWILRSEPDGMTEWLHWARTLFPPLILLSSIFILILRHGRLELPGNARGWLYYGLIGFSASLMSPEPLDAAYWGAAYLSGFAVINLTLGSKDRLESILQINFLSLLVVTVFLLIMIIFATDVLYVVKPSGITGYGIEGRMPTIAQMPMSRSSGIARFAAVPGLLSFVFLWFGKDWKRFFWLLPFLFFGWIIYIMQSRGAVIGFAFVIAFEMIFLSGRKWIIPVLFLLIFGIVLMSGAIPGEFFENIADYLKRGQSNEEFLSMTGRTRAWDLGWRETLEAPLIGRGFQADRYLITEHIHNTYLYALLTSGFTGAAAFVTGLLWSWVLFFRAIRRKIESDRKHKIFLVQIGGILAFFTVRGISEVSGAMFNVDFMILLPIITYLGIFEREYGKIVRVRLRW